jgi:hypothetical protein
MRNRTERPPKPRAVSRRSASAGPVPRSQAYSNTAVRTTARLPTALCGKVVYLAAPVALYQTLLYRRAERLLGEGGAALVISARDWFADHDTWIREFPGLIRQIHAIVVALGPDCTVGVGVVREIIEAVAHELLVYFLTPDFKFYELAHSRLLVPDRPTRRQFAIWTHRDRGCTLPGR